MTLRRITAMVLLVALLVVVLGVRQLNAERPTAWQQNGVQEGERMKPISRAELCAQASRPCEVGR